MTTTDRTHEGLQASRRSIVRGAAWSVPVVAVSTAAPAFAASPCDPLTITSFPMTGGSIGAASNGTRTWSRSLSTSTGASTTSTIQLSATSSYTNSMARAADQGIYAHFGTTNNAGNTGTPGLQMFQERGTASVATPSAHAGTYTFTFSRPVTNLTFTLSDIDYYAYSEQTWWGGTNNFYQYDDRVAVSSSESTFTVQSRGGNIVSSSIGSNDNPFRTNAAGQSAGNIDLDQGAGNVVLRAAGPLTTFSVTYWNGFTNANTQSRIQVTLLSAMSFTYAPCG